MRNVCIPLAESLPTLYVRIVLLFWNTNFSKTCWHLCRMRQQSPCKGNHPQHYNERNCQHDNVSIPLLTRNRAMKKAKWGSDCPYSQNSDCHTSYWRPPSGCLMNNHCWSCLSPSCSYNWLPTSYLSCRCSTHNKARKKSLCICCLSKWSPKKMSFYYQTVSDRHPRQHSHPYNWTRLKIPDSSYHSEKCLCSSSDWRNPTSDMHRY